MIFFEALQRKYGAQLIWKSTERGNAGRASINLPEGYESVVRDNTRAVLLIGSVDMNGRWRYSAFLYEEVPDVLVEKYL